MSAVRARGIDPEVAASVRAGVQIGAAAREQEIRNQAALQAQQANLLQTQARETEETRRALLLKALDHKEKAEAAASVDSKTFNKNYWAENTKGWVTKLRNEHPYQPEKWLTPENSWKLTPESQKQAQAYLLEVSQIEQNIARATPRDFNEFHDPAVFAFDNGNPLLSTPKNYGWTPEYSYEYLAEIGKKGKSGSSNGADDKASARLTKFQTARGDYFSKTGGYYAAGSQLNDLFTKYGGKEGWQAEAAAEGNVYDEDGKTVIPLVNSLFDTRAKLEPTATGAVGEFLTYAKDPNYLSEFFYDQIRGDSADDNLSHKTAQSAGMAVSDFIKSNAPKFNELRTADDVLRMKYWLKHSAGGGVNPYSGVNAIDLSSDAQRKAVAAKSYEVLFNEELFPGAK